MIAILLGLSQVVTASAVSASLHSPLSWSADGQWLAYTVASAPSPFELSPGWIYDDGNGSSGGFSGLLGVRAGNPPAGPTRYRIWAGHRSTSAAVLLEDSRSPLTAPSWGPDGRTLCFCRFVPRAGEIEGTLTRGRFEVVIQDGLEQKRVLLTLPDIELEPGQVAGFPSLAAAWSSDGQYLAIPRPGRASSLIIVRVEQGRVLKTLERATRPAWAPNALMLAYIETEAPEAPIQTLHVMGHDFKPSRPLLQVNPSTDVPAWSGDGQFVYVLATRLQGQVQALAHASTRELELVRVAIDSGAANPVARLGSVMDFQVRSRLAASSHERRPTGAGMVSLGLDREQDNFLCGMDLEGQESVVVFGNLRTSAIFKRFSTLDLALRIGSIALPPDGRILAARVETAGGSCLPVFCDPLTESPTLIAPDESARREWLTTLLAVSGRLLVTALPSTTPDRPSPRPTILPIPGEIPDQNAVNLRLKRLARIGKSFLEQPGVDATGRIAETPSVESNEESRLLFDYLKQDYASVEADIESLEARTSDPGRRARLLGLRAQMLIARRELDRAKEMVAYIRRVDRGPSFAFEETPLGPALIPASGLAESWPEKLAARLAQASAIVEAATIEKEPDESEDDQPRRVLEGLSERPTEGGPMIRFPMPFPRPGLPGFEPDRAGEVPPRPRFLPPPFPRPIPPMPPAGLRNRPGGADLRGLPR